MRQIAASESFAPLFLPAAPRRSCHGWLSLHSLPPPPPTSARPATTTTCCCCCWRRSPLPRRRRSPLLLLARQSECEVTTSASCCERTSSLQTVRQESKRRRRAGYEYDSLRMGGRSFSRSYCVHCVSQAAPAGLRQFLRSVRGRFSLCLSSAVQKRRTDCQAAATLLSSLVTVYCVQQK